MVSNCFENTGDCWVKCFVVGNVDNCWMQNFVLVCQYLLLVLFLGVADTDLGVLSQIKDGRFDWISIWLSNLPIRNLNP